MSAQKPVFGPPQTESIFVKKWLGRAILLNSGVFGSTLDATWGLAAFDHVVAFKKDLQATRPHVAWIPEKVLDTYDEIEGLVNSLVCRVLQRHPNFPPPRHEQAAFNAFMDKVTLAEIDGTWTGPSEEQQKQYGRLTGQLAAGMDRDGRVGFAEALRKIFIKG